MSSLTSKSHNRLQVLSQHINPKQKQQISASVPQSLSFQTTSAATASGSSTSTGAYPHKRKAVIVTGVRTPFVKAFGELLEVDAIGLGCSAVSGLLQKTKLDPEQIDEIIWGNVVMNIKAPNVAREIVIDLNLPRKIPGVTVSRACLSGMQAIIQAVQMIEHGDAHCVIAGGSDSMSNGEISLPRNLTHALGKYKYGKKTGLAGVVQFFKDAGSPTTWVPQPPAIAERSTGKTMGYHADLMAELNNVSREAQDALAALSHQNAGKAVKEGKFAEEIVPITLASGKKVSKDNLIRESSDANKMSKLKPVFRKQGTVTAASSSPLTDGASCVLVMSEERARELGFPTDVTLVSSANSAVDPFPQLLLAPAFAIPKALDEAGLKIDDIDLFEIHEAFAAQVLSTTACLASDSFAQKRLGKSKAVGVIPPNKMNVNGGSIAIGHPFSATGGRLVTTAINEMRRTKKKYALLSICAAGGMGGALILKRD